MFVSDEHFDCKKNTTRRKSCKHLYDLFTEVNDYLSNNYFCYDIKRKHAIVLWRHIFLNLASCKKVKA